MVHMDDKGGQGLVAMQKLWDRHLHKQMKPILQGLGVILLSQAGNMHEQGWLRSSTIQCGWYRSSKALCYLDRLCT